MLLTGGDKHGYTSAEIYDPSSKSSCILPSLPSNIPPTKYGHTQDGPFVCGGGGPLAVKNSTCLQWNSEKGSWPVSHLLKKPRYNHVSWTPPNGRGTYLLGGWYSPRSASLIKSDGSEEDAFQLKYTTM